ncbi:MAG: LD-carboxypeptidase [Candidatus Omnitrophota bacterium]
MKRSHFGKILPRRLKKGDTIGIVAPACHFDPVKFRKGVKYLKSLGYNVKFDPIIFKKYWTLAGKDVTRAKQINRMFADKEVKAIMCAQAGYGSIRTIPYLDKRMLAHNSKIFVGYSDITILLSYLQKTAKMVVFHGPVVSSEIHEKMNPGTLDLLVKVITRLRPLGEITYPGIQVLRPGKATGELIGGNLSLIISTIGTPYDLNANNKILFIEDVSESLEAIDSCLMHLKLAGKLNKVKGIIFGRMKDCLNFSGSKYSIKDVLDDMLRDVNIPIIYGFPSGHRQAGELNITIPFGVSVTLDADNKKVVFNEPAVSS